MNSQGTAILEPIGEDERYKDATEVAFERYHEQRPYLYHLLVRFAREVRATGRTQYSIRAVWERVRWHVEIEMGKHLGLNDKFMPLYARLIMAQEKDLAGFFVTRSRWTR